MPWYEAKSDPAVIATEACAVRHILARPRLCQAGSALGRPIVVLPTAINQRGLLAKVTPKADPLPTRGNTQRKKPDEHKSNSNDFLILSEKNYRPCCRLINESMPCGRRLSVSLLILAYDDAIPPIPQQRAAPTCGPTRVGPRRGLQDSMEKRGTS